MKHLTRVRTMRGFSHLPSAERPSRVVIQHQDSFEEYALPLTWGREWSGKRWPSPPGGGETARREAGSKRQGCRSSFE